MSDLTAFRDHAAAMAEARHKPECPSLRKRRPIYGPDYIGENGKVYGSHQVGWDEPPACPGCVTDEDRALWTRLADEADRYLYREPEETLL